MVEPGQWNQVYFRNSTNGTWAPIVIYADLESAFQPKEGGPRPALKSQMNEEHQPCTVGYKVESYLPTLDEPYQVIDGPDSVKKYISHMSRFERKALDYYNDDKGLIMCA